MTLVSERMNTSSIFITHLSIWFVVLSETVSAALPSDGAYILIIISSINSTLPLTPETITIPNTRQQK
jgi:hypothetical protein